MSHVVNLVLLFAFCTVAMVLVGWVGGLYLVRRMASVHRARAELDAWAAENGLHVLRSWQALATRKSKVGRKFASIEGGTVMRFHALTASGSVRTGFLLVPKRADDPPPVAVAWDRADG